MTHGGPRLRLKLRHLLALCAALALMVPAGAQQSLDDLKRDLKAASEAIEDAQAEVDHVSGEIDELVADIEDLVESIDGQAAAVSAARRSLEEAEDEVVRRDLAAARSAQDIVDTEAAIQVRLVDAYIGTAGAPEDWLDSRDLNRTAVKQTLLEVAAGSERELLDRLRTHRAELEEHLREGEAAREEAAMLRLAAEEALLVLEGLKAELDAELDKLAAEKGNWEAEVARRLRDSEEIEEEIKRLLAEQAGVPGDPSAQGYIRPAHGRVSSEFGNRVHPIFGIVRLHAGIDIGAPTGRPIFASKDGRVIFVGDRGGYGQTVIIQHAGPYATLYAHMSAYEVEQGEWVIGGEVIGRIGSTGWSTGPHLHFEIRENGKPINPRCCVDF